MCIILFGVNEHERYKLVVAANRDEYYGRPSEAAHFWLKNSNILAGRDLLEGGTWLGVNLSGRFAAVTNYPHPNYPYIDCKSRGELVCRYLDQTESTSQFANYLASSRYDYNGYSLLFGSYAEGKVHYFSNRCEQKQTIAMGIHGLSNYLLDYHWVRVEEGKSKLATLLSDQREVHMDDIFKILGDRVPFESTYDSIVKFETTKPADLPIFFQTEVYGTRCSTVVLVDQNNFVKFEERTYDPNLGKYTTFKKYAFQIEGN